MVLSADDSRTESRPQRATCVADLIYQGAAVLAALLMVISAVV